MATTLPSFLHVQIVNNLDTYNHTLTGAGQRNISATMTENVPSGLTVVIQKNGSTIATSPAIVHRHQEIAVNSNCADGDVISFIISSSTATDQPPQSFKITLNVHQSASRN